MVALAAAPEFGLCTNRGSLVSGEGERDRFQAPPSAGGWTSLAIRSWLVLPASSIRESRSAAPTRLATEKRSVGDNDLRVFLANMARARHDGNSIGITDEDSGSVWVDD